MRGLLASTLLVATIILAGALGAQELVVLPDVGALYAHDATGALVGAFYPTPTSEGHVDGMIRIEILGEGIVHLPVADFGEGPVWKTAAVYFATTDCTGEAYTKLARSITGVIALVGPGNVLLVANYDDPQDGPFPNSRFSISASGSPRCEVSSSGGGGRRLRVAAKLDERFPLPLSIGTAVSKSRAVRTSGSE